MGYFRGPKTVPASCMSWSYVFNQTNKALGAALARDRLYGLHILQIQKTNPDISCARLLLIDLLDSYKPQHRVNWITVHHKMIPIIILIIQKNTIFSLNVLYQPRFKRHVCCSSRRVAAPMSLSAALQAVTKTPLHFL